MMIVIIGIVVIVIIAVIVVIAIESAPKGGRHCTTFADPQ